MSPLMIALLFVKDAQPLILHELHLVIPTWGQNLLRQRRLVVFSAMPQGISMSTAPSTNALAVINKLPVTPNTIVSGTTAPSVVVLPTWPDTVLIDVAPSATPLTTFSLTVLLQRTQAQESSSVRETLRDSEVVLVVQVFEGGIVTI